MEKPVDNVIHMWITLWMSLWINLWKTPGGNVYQTTRLRTENRGVPTHAITKRGIFSRGFRARLQNAEIFSHTLRKSVHMLGWGLCVGVVSVTLVLCTKTKPSLPGLTLLPTRRLSSMTIGGLRMRVLPPSPLMRHTLWRLPICVLCCLSTSEILYFYPLTHPFSIG